MIVLNIMLTLEQKKTYIQTYIAQLTVKEKQAYEIAKKYLGSSFDLEKSIGFLSWLKNNNINI